MKIKKRIKTNIIELSKLEEKPCEEWLNRFKDGKIDAHEAFKKYGQRYWFLYLYSNYDLISWEIENGLFNWEDCSDSVARFCPENFDPEKFNWERFSWAVAQFCPENLDTNKYNWEDSSWAVAKYHPDGFDSEKFYWKDFSWAVLKYCPEKFDPEKFNWKGFYHLVKKYCPEKLALMPEKYKKIIQ